MADAIQDEHEATFKFIEEVHNCPAMWNISSVVYKDTKNEQKKMEELVDKLGFIQTFLFLHRFLFLLFSSSVSLSYVSATVPSWPCCKLPCVVKWRKFDLWRYEFANFLKLICQHEFANLSLPREGCFTIAQQGEDIML